MSETSVPELLARLGAKMETMPPQLRKAAAYVLDHPDDIGFGSVREIAAEAGVTPNSMVRMAQTVGYSGFDELRNAFREQLRTNGSSLHGRAEWLQSISAEGRLGSLYVDIAGSAVHNVQRVFEQSTVEQFLKIAGLVTASRQTYVVGVGANYALAHNFAYLVGMAMDNVIAVPQEGNVPIDMMVRAGPEDLVIGMTFEPYRSEIVETMAIAREQGAATVAITDSHGSPIAVGANHVILTPSEGPQFFPSTLAAAAALETLASLVVAEGGEHVVAAIDRFHNRRYDLDVYWKEDA